MLDGARHVLELAQTSKSPQPPLPLSPILLSLALDRLITWVGRQGSTKSGKERVAWTIDGACGGRSRVAPLTGRVEKTKVRKAAHSLACSVKGGGTAWLDGNVSSRSGLIYNHAVDRSRESSTFSVLS
jgi:hypothetical protein